MGMPADTAAIIPAPVAGSVFRRSTSTSSERNEIPAGWFGGKVTFVALSSDAEVVFGGSSVSVTQGQVSSRSSETLTASSATGFTCPAGVPVTFDVIPGAYTHFAVVSSGSGAWVAYRSTR